MQGKEGLGVTLAVCRVPNYEQGSRVLQDTLLTLHPRPQVPPTSPEKGQPLHQARPAKTLRTWRDLCPPGLQPSAVASSRSDLRERP